MSLSATRAHEETLVPIEPPCGGRRLIAETFEKLRAIVNYLTIGSNQRSHSAQADADSGRATTENRRQFLARELKLFAFRIKRPVRRLNLFHALAWIGYWSRYRKVIALTLDDDRVATRSKC